MNFDFASACAGQLSAVSRKGELLFPPQTCKDYTKDGISRGVNRDWATKRNQYDPGVKKGQISLERPTFVYWTKPDTVDRNAVKFTQLINQVETILSVPASHAYPVSSGATDDAAPFVAEADGWWVKSPVATDFYLLLMRLSITMRLNEDLQLFIDRMTGTASHSRHPITRDAGYLNRAKINGTLSGFLENSLPCLNREGYSDHLLSSNERGIASYSIKADKKHPLDEASLIKGAF